MRCTFLDCLSLGFQFRYCSDDKWTDMDMDGSGYGYHMLQLCSYPFISLLRVLHELYTNLTYGGYLRCSADLWTRTVSTPSFFPICQQVLNHHQVSCSQIMILPWLICHGIMSHYFDMNPPMQSLFCPHVSLKFDAKQTPCAAGRHVDEGITTPHHD